MQKPLDNVGVSPQVKKELQRRKEALSNKKGRAATFDEVVRELLGWGCGKC